jgi:putative lipoic acid-binding regulatory protein
VTSHAHSGLTITEQGLLVDELNGQVVNQLGATRFDVAVTAMQGALDPPQWVDNSERNTDGLILGALVQFPTRHCFSIVGANTPEYQADVLAIIQRACEVDSIPEADVTSKPRLGGKFVSIQVDVQVRAPEIVSATVAAIAKDPRTKMSY